MADKIQGLFVEIAGDTLKFDKSMNGVNKALRANAFEGRNLNKALKLDPTSVDNLNSKMKQLQTRQELTTMKLEDYNAELKQLGSADLNPEEWARLSNLINKTQTELNAVEKEMKQVDSAIDNLGIKKLDQEISEVNQELKDFDRALKVDPGNIELIEGKFNALAQKEQLATQKVQEYNARLSTIGDEDIGTDDWIRLNKQLEKAERELNSVQAEMKQVDSASAGIGTNASGSIGEMGGALVGVGASLTAVGTATARLAVQVGQDFTSMSAEADTFKAAFGVMADEVAQNNNEIAQSLGIPQREIDKLSTKAKNMGVNFGFSNDQSSDFSESLTSTTAAAASFLGVPLDDASERATAAIRGEAEAIENLGSGFTLNETFMSSFVQKSGKTWSSMTDGEKATARLAAFQTQLAQQMGVTVDGSGDLSAALSNGNIFLEEAGKETTNYQKAVAGIKDIWNDLVLALGPVIEDFALIISEKVLPVLQRFVDYLSNNEWAGKFIIAVGLISLALGPLLLIFGAFLLALPGLTAGFGILSGALSGLSVVILPIILAVVGLALAFKQAYTESEELRNIVSQVFLAIQLVITTVLTTISGIWQTFVQFLKDIWAEYGDTITQIFITAFQIIGIILVVFYVIWTKLVELLKLAWSIFGDELVTFFGTAFELIGAILEIFKFAFIGIVVILQALWAVFGDSITIAFQGAMTQIEGLLNIFSGAFMVITGLLTGDWDKMAQGLKKIWDGVLKIMKGLFTSLFIAPINAVLAIFGTDFDGFVNGIKGAWQGVCDFMAGLWNNTIGAMKEGLNDLLSLLPGGAKPSESFGVDNVGRSRLVNSVGFTNSNLRGGISLQNQGTTNYATTNQISKPTLNFNVTKNQTIDEIISQVRKQLMEAL